MPMTPETFNRRSFVHPRLVAAGAEFRKIADAALASTFPGEAERALGLADLSPVPRTGVKGPRALAWLGEQGWPVPQTNNQAVANARGYTVARLSDSEALILGSPSDDGEALFTLEEAAPGQGVWPTPRRDSHCWFRLHGAAVVDCLQKLCGVDLRERAFPVGTIAQTSVARLNAIVIREADESFHLLTDSASAIWFWDALLDAMDEFDGGPVGA